MHIHAAHEAVYHILESTFDIRDAARAVSSRAQATVQAQISVLDVQNFHLRREVEKGREFLGAHERG